LSGNIFRQQALDKLQSPDDLNELMMVTSPKSWLLLAAISLLLLSAVTWGFFATIETSVSGSGIITTNGEEATEAEAVLYVSVADGKRIRPQMEARISPSTIRREEFGMLLAEVTSVNQIPSTQEEMLGILKNDALVQSLASSGAIIEVRLDLVEDESTPSGYAWTSAEGPPALLWEGTLSEGTIVVDRQRPVELIARR
jgi:HlyD family secretion protein